MTPRLDWRPSFDERSRAHPIRALMPTAPPPPVRRLWRAGTVLDQGSEGACVGFAWTGALLAAPAPARPPADASPAAAYAVGVYVRAKVLDDFPGEAYEGTSVLAGAKVLAERGLIDSYRWCFAISDVRAALQTVGPVVVGIPWYESMYRAGARGEVTVRGERIGGHALVLTGYDPAHRRFGGREMFRWRNSWGAAYGLRGNGWIGADVLARLLAQQGEACVPIGRKRLGL